MPPTDLPPLDPPRADAALQLVFRGECLAGRDPLAVRHALAVALKLDEPGTARLFSGRRVVLRRDVDMASAHRHIARFALMGAVLHAEPSTARPATRRRRARPPWRRPLQWAGVISLCLVGGLLIGLVIGPGLNALWPDPDEADMATEPARATPPPPLLAPTTVAEAPTPAIEAPKPASLPTTTPAAATAVGAGASGGTPANLTTEAAREHRLGYRPARRHKAFAVSSGGTAHAWQAGAASEDEARERALTACLAALRPGDNGCHVVDVDDQWQE